MTKHLLLLIISTLCLSSQAQYGPVSVSDDYSVHSGSGFRIIYSDEYKGLIPELSGYTSWFLNQYEGEFNWELDQEFTLLLASSSNQIPNGFVTPLPRLYSTFYNGSAELMDEFASISWLYDLLSHELVHAYQVNTKGPYGKFLHRFLRNPFPNFIPPFTYVLYPHVFTPTFIMEGNATFNEGRFGNGGRLHSGLYRALFLQLVKNEKVTKQRLMNDHLDWPYGTEKYIVGGYLQSHIAEEVGVEKTNRFFANHAKKEFFPFTIDDSFEGSFGFGYREAIKGLNKKYKELAKTQKSAKGEVIATSKSHAAFNRVDGSVAFMRTDAETELEVCKWKTSKASICCESVRMPFGRVFKYEDEWASTAYSRLNPTRFEAGLYKDGYEPVEKFKNKYLFAINKDQTLYADSPASFKEVIIYKNNEKLGTTQASPFMDASGNVYYFRQDSDGRRLIKNQEVLANINGFYGKVVDVNSDGHIYFTASVDKGSALFVFKNSEIHRAHNSDLIIDAMLTGRDNEVLVAEVTNEGYDYKVTQLIKLPEADEAENITKIEDLPVFYNYKFDNTKDEVFKTPIASENLSSSLANISNDKEYKPFSNIELTGIDTSVALVNPDGFVGIFNFSFSDPLQRYLLDFSVRDSGWSSPGARLSFLFAKYRLAYELIADYGRVPQVSNTTGEVEDQELIGHSSEVIVRTGFVYPLISTPLWSSAIALRYLYENENADDPEVEAFVNSQNTNKGLLSYNIGYNFKPGSLSYNRQQAFNFALHSKVQGEKSAWKPKSHAVVGEVSVTQNLGWKMYFSSSYRAGLSEGDFPSLEFNDDAFFDALDPTDFSALGTVSTSYFYQLRKVNVELKRPFYLGLYHHVFPLGLWRVAPVAGYNEYYGSQVAKTSVDTLFHEAYYGLEAEVLLLHKLPIFMRYLSVKQNEETSSEFVLGLDKEF